MDIFRLFRRKPKADLGLTDNIALELLRAHLETHCNERVYLIQTRLWTSDSVVVNSARKYDLRTVKIEARPVAFVEPATHGLYDPDVLPRVEAHIMFRSDETSVYSWQFQVIELVVQRWGRRNLARRKGYAACEVPELMQLSKRLFEYRNGNEIKYQAPAQGVRAPRYMGAPTS